MKNTLLTITLLTSLFTFAQDGYSLDQTTYKTIYNNVTQLDSLSARNFANSIMSSTITKYEFWELKTRKKSASYYYIESGLSAEALLDQKELGCSKCMRVNFRVYESRYVFLDVSGKLQDILPTWKRDFLPTATIQLIDDSFKYRTVKNTEIGVDVRLTKSQNIWKIYNWSI